MEKIKWEMVQKNRRKWISYKKREISDFWEFVKSICPNDPQPVKLIHKNGEIIAELPGFLIKEYNSNNSTKFIYVSLSGISTCSVKSYGEEYAIERLIGKCSGKELYKNNEKYRWWKFWQPKIILHCICPRFEYY